MVDVLINCLLKNKEISEELASVSPTSSDRVNDTSDGEENLRAFYDHPLTAATTAMLNVGGAGSEEQSVPLELLCEYYKLPLDKMDKALVDKCAALPDFWTSITSTGQAGIIKNDANAAGNSLPLSLLPQAAELLKNRRLSDFNGISQQDIDICINRGLVKRESAIVENEEIIVPTSDSIDKDKSSDILKNNNAIRVMSTSSSDSSTSPLPILVQVKHEPNLELQTSPSPPISKAKELPLVNSVFSQAYSSHILAQNYENLAVQYTSATLPQYQTQPTTSVYMLTTPSESRGLPDYYTEEIRHNLAATVATTLPAYTDATDTASLVDRYIKQSSRYKDGIQGLTLNLPSPDSGIGDTIIASRDTASLSQVGEVLYYSDLTRQANLLLPDSVPSRPSSSHSGSSRKSSSDCVRHLEPDKLQIPKIHSDVGFKYFLESSISTSQRRDDDRITYINKGQYYGVTLQYVPDAEKPLKNSTVRSVIMLMFREEKPPDEELRAWQFWHNRQHSSKQRILDADTKNSTGIIGQIDDISHNAVAFYWNPLEGPAKVNVAAHCLSTDFSNQKGVKGLPLHLQLDTFDELRENATPCHRGYCQIKVFCDKGAERKTRDEERRAAKRKLAASSAGDGVVQFPGRKPLDELYHLPCERSEFYSMADLLKPPILFMPSNDGERSATKELDLSFYSNHNSTFDVPGGSGMEVSDGDFSSVNGYSPPEKRIKVYPSNRVLLYSRQETESIYQPIHVVPITVAALAKGIENKYNIKASQIRNIYKQNKKGATIQFDDEEVNACSNEDYFIIKVNKVTDELYDIILVEL